MLLDPYMGKTVTGRNVCDGWEETSHHGAILMGAQKGRRAKGGVSWILALTALVSWHDNLKPDSELPLTAKDQLWCPCWAVMSQDLQVNVTSLQK